MDVPVVRPVRDSKASVHNNRCCMSDNKYVEVIVMFCAYQSVAVPCGGGVHAHPHFVPEWAK